MKDLKDKLLTVFYNFAVLLPYIIGIFAIIIYIYIIIKYGNRPLSEVPAFIVLLLK